MKDEEKNKKTDPEEIVIDAESDIDDSVVAEESLQDTIKKLREKLKKATAEKQEYLTGWQRARADYANFKKEQEENKKKLVMFANERLFDELIPVLDSFDMAFGNKEAWEKVDMNWRVGIHYIYNQMLKALENHGMVQYSPKEGDKFDAQKHEPVGTVPTDDNKKENHIALIMKKGYMLSSQVFRPAQVKVWEKK